jgi:ribose-phosphate pyrophosphokinase
VESGENVATTELSRLPGLETVTEHARPEPGHYIERGPQKRLMVFSGRSHPALARSMAEKLGVELGDVDLKTFANDETYCRYLESIRGADVFIVQTGVGEVDRNLMELVFMIQAAKLASAKRITAVVPLFPYARQDRKAKPREPISARLVADMIQLAGADRVLTMDLHAGQIQGFFEVPVDHMTALPMFQQYFLDLGLPRDEIVVISPDTGRVKLAKKFAEMLGGELAVLTKERPAHSHVQVTNVIGDVAGKTCVISDDMIDTAGTLVAGAQAIHDAGARCIYACATHPVFSEPALQRLEDSVLEQVVVCDTIPVDPTTRPDKVRVLSVARILAETIHNVFTDDSVSAIFKGENQLF